MIRYNFIIIFNLNQSLFPCQVFPFVFCTQHQQQHKKNYIKHSENLKTNLITGKASFETQVLINICG